MHSVWAGRAGSPRLGAQGVATHDAVPLSLCELGCDLLGRHVHPDGVEGLGGGAREAGRAYFNDSDEPRLSRNVVVNGRVAASAATPDRAVGAESTPPHGRGGVWATT